MQVRYQAALRPDLERAFYRAHPVFSSVSHDCFILTVAENLNAQPFKVLDRLFDKLCQASVFFLLASERRRQIRHACGTIATNGRKLGILICQAILKTVLLRVDGLFQMF